MDFTLGFSYVVHFVWFLSSPTMFPSDPLLQLLCHFFSCLQSTLKIFFCPSHRLLSSISCTPSEMGNLKSRDHIWKSVVWGPFTILLRWYCSGIWDLCCFRIILGIAFSNSVRNVTGILMGSAESVGSFCFHGVIFVSLWARKIFPLSNVFGLIKLPLYKSSTCWVIFLSWFWSWKDGSAIKSTKCSC